MTEADTQQFSKNESKAFGISIRAWLALILVETVCLLALWQIKVEEPLYSISIMAVSFYFGQKNSPNAVKN